MWEFGKVEMAEKQQFDLVENISSKNMEMFSHEKVP
jgi:hypothetical protein